MDEAFEVGWLEAHRLHLARPVARAEIVGIGHVMQALESLVGLLRDPARGAAMGARAPRGILLWGDPGVGKTLSARYLAGAVGNLPMYEVAADELSPARVRGLFGHLAAAHARCILYLDEVDLIALNRSTELHSEGTRATLVALLAALDGLRDTAGPILVASSNRSPYELDPALLRAGRIGYHVRFGLPSAAERRELLEVFLRGRPLEPDVDPAALAAYALRATPASLAQAVDDAAGGAIARGAARIGQADLVVAIARAGEIEPEEGEGGSEGARALAALHEAGHVAVAVALRGPAWVTRVRLDPRGGRSTVGSEDVPLEALPVSELRDRLAETIRTHLGRPIGRISWTPPYRRNAWTVENIDEVVALTDWLADTPPMSPRGYRQFASLRETALILGRAARGSRCGRVVVPNGDRARIAELQAGMPRREPAYAPLPAAPTMLDSTEEAFCGGSPASLRRRATSGSNRSAAAMRRCSPCRNASTTASSWWASASGSASARSRRPRRRRGHVRSRGGSCGARTTASPSLRTCGGTPSPRARPRRASSRCGRRPWASTRLERASEGRRAKRG